MVNVAELRRAGALAVTVAVVPRPRPPCRETARPALSLMMNSRLCKRLAGRSCPAREEPRISCRHQLPRSQVRRSPNLSQLRLRWLVKLSSHRSDPLAVVSTFSRKNPGVRDDAPSGSWTEMSTSRFSRLTMMESCTHNCGDKSLLVDAIRSIQAYAANNSQCGC